MRLPGTINTKPERNEVRVSVIESYPEHRYPLTAFAWLQTQPQIERSGGTNVVKVNGNGHHQLPRRTEMYLAAGAAEHQRNSELFAVRANCAMRGTARVKLNGN